MGLRAVAIALAAAVALTAAASAASPGKLVRVNGHRLYVECAGKGAPAVVIDGGLGESTLYFTQIQAAVAKLPTRVCSYDRLGVGQSDRARGARPVADATADLHVLLRTVGLRTPVVLASHSIGGLIDRYYTKLYPKDVAGLVLVESAPDDWDVFQKMTTFSGGEALDIGRAAAALREGDSLGARPLVVVQAGKFEQLGAGDPAFAKYWPAAQRALAGLSSNSLFVVAARSDHEVETTQPGLFAASVKLVVQAVRTHGKLPACTATTLPRLGGRCG